MNAEDIEAILREWMAGHRFTGTITPDGDRLIVEMDAAFRAWWVGCAEAESARIERDGVYEYVWLCDRLLARDAIIDETKMTDGRLVAHPWMDAAAALEDE